MKKFVLMAALVAATAAAQPASAADKAKTSCPPASAREAEQAIRFVTQLGIASNACTSMGVYADFRVRNRDAIVEYQKAMIAHLRGNAAYDRWNTGLANALAQQQSSVTPAKFCEQSVPLLEQAKTLDMPRFRAYAAAQAAAASCAK